MTKWNWTDKAHRLADNLIAGACLIMAAGIIVLMFWVGTN